MVGSSKNTAYKRSRKIYVRNSNCFNITHKVDCYPSSFKSFVYINTATHMSNIFTLQLFHSVEIKVKIFIYSCYLLSLLNHDISDVK